MQHRAILRDIDRVAAKHRLDALAQSGLLGELDQQPQRLVGDAVLGVVEIDPGALDREALPALGIIREELPQMQALSPLVVLLQRFPSRERAQRGSPRWLVLGLRRRPRALLGGHCHLCQPAFRIALALPSTQRIRSFQDLTKDAAPSS